MKIVDGLPIPDEGEAYVAGALCVDRINVECVWSLATGCESRGRGQHEQRNPGRTIQR
jgi:hypothetical protein